MFIKKIRSILKFIIMGPIQYVIDVVEFSRVYKSVNKFLRQYENRAIMIRVTSDQAKLLIVCTQLGILNIKDINKLCKEQKFIEYLQIERKVFVDEVMEKTKRRIFFPEVESFIIAFDSVFNKYNELPEEIKSDKF